MGAALGASVAGSAIGMVGGYSKWREGRKMAKAAQNAIDNFEWQNLENPYRNLAVSTMGADLQREEASRAASSNIEALRASGTRGLGVGVGRVQQSVNLNNRQIGADLDQQRKALDYAAASDDVRIRDMVENRQANELAGYGQMLNVGNQTKWGGVADIINATQSAGQSVMAYDAYKSAYPSTTMKGMGGGMMGGQQSPVITSYGSGLTPSTSYGTGLPQPASMNNPQTVGYYQTWNPYIYN